MGRPPKFSREQVQAAALEIVDRDGLGALSMRAVAAALGTGAMTLYNHAGGREDLEVLVVEAVLADVHWRVPPQADWRAEVHAIATAAWRAMRSHPHALPLILTRRSRQPSVIAMAEALLAALAPSGRAGPDLLIAFRAVTAFIMGFCQAELAGPLAVAAGESRALTVQRFRTLPRERYPQLVQLADVAFGSDAGEEFRAGLDALLAGLEGPARAAEACRPRVPR